MYSIALCFCFEFFNLSACLHLNLLVMYRNNNFKNHGNSNKGSFSSRTSSSSSRRSPYNARRFDSRGADGSSPSSSSATPAPSFDFSDAGNRYFDLDSCQSISADPSTKLRTTLDYFADAVVKVIYRLDDNFTSRKPPVNDEPKLQRINIDLPQTVTPYNIGLDTNLRSVVIFDFYKKMVLVDLASDFSAKMASLLEPRSVFLTGSPSSTGDDFAALLARSLQAKFPTTDGHVIDGFSSSIDRILASWNKSDTPACVFFSFKNLTGTAKTSSGNF